MGDVFGAFLKKSEVINLLKLAISLLLENKRSIVVFVKP